MNGSKIGAYLILNQKLDTLDWGSSSFRDGSRNTTHYTKMSIETLIAICRFLYEFCSDGALCSTIVCEPGKRSHTQKIDDEALDT